MKIFFFLVFLVGCLVVSGATFAVDNVANSRGVVDVEIAPMEDFSGLTANEVLLKRTFAVNSSPVFGYLKNYAPSRSVFQLADKAPWISAQQISCYGVYKSADISLGASRESVGILNPELLYYIAPENFAFSEKYGCSYVDYLAPTKIVYDAASETISAYIDYSSFDSKNGQVNLFVRDANARDLGYNYAYVDYVQNIRFKNPENLANTLVNTRGFYHLAHSCRHPKGCNNYSPFDHRYEFYVDKVPAKMHIVLYKDMPEPSPAIPQSEYMEKPAVNFELIFE